MNNEIKLETVMTSESFWLWFPCSQNEISSGDKILTFQTFPEVQVKEHNREDIALIPTSYLHINGNLQGYHETENENKENFIFHAPFVGVSVGLFSLLDDASSSDVTIKCGDEILKVHKCILAAESSIFEAMFSDSAYENSECIVLIDNFEIEIVRDLVVFLNSNEIPNLSMSKACNLLPVAEKYQLQKLKDICCEFLKPILTYVDFRNELPYVSKSTFIVHKARNETIFS